MKQSKFIRRKTDRINWMHRILAALAIIPFIAISLGTNNLIDSSSPAILLSFYQVMEGFFSNISGHLYILIGSFLLTAIIWDLTHDFWDN